MYSVIFYVKECIYILLGRFLFKGYLDCSFPVLSVLLICPFVFLYSDLYHEIKYEYENTEKGMRVFIATTILRNCLFIGHGCEFLGTKSFSTYIVSFCGSMKQYIFLEKQVSSLCTWCKSRKII